MRILYVVSRWGEPTETFVRREVEAARTAGHDLHVLSLKRPCEAAIDVPVTHLDRREVLAGLLSEACRHPRRTIRLLRLLKGSSIRNLPRHGFALALALASADRLPSPDWIHAHFAWLSATTAWGAATLRGVPFGVMPHAHDIYEHELIDGLLRRKLQAASLVVVESERIRAHVREALDCDGTVLRMGVPDDYVGPPRRFDGQSRRVVAVGALRRKKGHDVLIEAVAGLPTTTLRIVGEGQERATLERATEATGCSDRIAIVGRLPESEVIEELDAADVFALASRITPEGDRDGVPNVLIEAMARGVPVVSTDVAGIPDLLLPDRGTVVPSDDVTALRDAIAELLANDDLWNRRSSAAQDHVRRHYTVTANWTRLEGMITEIVSG